MPAVVRIGIINLMPRAQSYEASLLAPLLEANVPFEPVWIRLRTHGYASSDSEHIQRTYQPFDQAGTLDGLLLSGAPVEELEFDAVTYWLELAAILRQARESVASTLGLCWGGLALAQLLGIDKIQFENKLFGVFQLRNLDLRHPVLGASGDVFACPQSRHSGIADAALERAEADGRVHLLAHSAAAGYSIFESSDRRFLMHLGHPEYEPERLRLEYERDVAADRRDVPPPNDFDVQHPISTWTGHRRALFGEWLRSLQTSG